MAKADEQAAWAIIYGPTYPDKYEGTPIRGRNYIPLFWTRAGAKEWMQQSLPESREWRIVRVTVKGVRAI